MRVVSISLAEAERVLRERKQYYSRSELEVVKVHALKEGSQICGLAIWGRVDERTAKRIHIYTDGRALGWTILYGQGCRALGSDGFTTIEL